MYTFLLFDFRAPLTIVTLLALCWFLTVVVKKMTYHYNFNNFAAVLLSDNLLFK